MRYELTGEARAASNHHRHHHERQNPRLVKRFNYRVMWADGQKGPAKLAVANYSYGHHAAYNSWVILQQNT